MKLLRFLIPLFLFITACAHLPEIKSPADGAPADVAADCDHIFPRGNWQFLHTIEASPPGGGTQTMLGLSQISSDRRTAHCVMMTLEGLVVFEADYDNGIQIQRAVPPFNMPGFAEGLIDDLLLIFFAPEHPMTRAGHLKDGPWVCRYPLADGGTQDILVRNGADWEIRRYNRQNRLIRSVHPDAAAGRSPKGYPKRIILNAPGLAGYQLIMTLVEAEALETE